MNQNVYLNEILERFEMSECKPRTSPCEQKIEHDNDEVADAKKYSELVGSLIYAMICTRPDICWLVTKLSQHLVKQFKEHFTAAKHVLGYLKHTIDYKLSYKQEHTRQ